MARIGFVGLGNMGGPMAANLVRAGQEVRGFDLDAAALERLRAAGGNAVGRVGEAATDAQVVVTMLPEGRHVQAVYQGEDGILANAAGTALLIDCSTIDVETARAVHAAAAAKGMAMVDAPVSGGVGGATNATLTFMVGGEAEAYALAQPVLAAMGKTVIHTGPAGTGQAAKICNNLMLGIQMISVCEAMALAEQLGLDTQKLFDVSSKSSGQCWSLTSYCPVPGPVPSSPANRDYSAGFTVAMMRKDLKLAQQAAQTVDARTPLAAEAYQLYSLFAQGENLGLDFSAIIKMIRIKPG